MRFSVFETVEFSFYHSIVAKPHMWWHYVSLLFLQHFQMATDLLIYTLFSLFFALIKKNCDKLAGKYLHFLADQLTLFQLGRADYALAPPIFSTFRHPKDIREKTIEFIHKLHMTFNFCHLFYTRKEKCMN